jgi:hypothetical protein
LSTEIIMYMTRLFIVFIVLLGINTFVFIKKPVVAMTHTLDLFRFPTSNDIIKVEDRTEEFMDRIAFLEGSCNPRAISPSGSYIGKYQFGKLAFAEVGHRIEIRKFKKNPAIFPEYKQDELFLKLCKANKTYLDKEIEKYSGKKMKGIRITKAGILASAHLIGQKWVKRFLKSNGRIDKADGNGKKCSDYMREFQDIENEHLSIASQLEKYK